MYDSHVWFWWLHKAALISVTVGDGYIVEEYEL